MPKEKTSKQLMAEFVEVSKQLGIASGFVEKEKTKAETKTKKPRSGPRKPAADKVASPRLQAAMRKQQADRVAMREKKVAEAQRKLKVRIDGLVELARVKADGEGSSSYAKGTMDELKVLMGEQNDDLFRSFSQEIKKTTIKNLRKAGKSEAKNLKYEALHNLIKPATMAAGAGAAILALPAASLAIGTQAGKSLGKGLASFSKEQARASRIASRPPRRMHGPERPPMHGPERPPGKMHGPDRPPSAKAEALEGLNPPRRHPRRGQTGSKAGEEEYLLDRYGPPSGPAKAPVDRQIAQGTTRFSGPSTLKKPKLLSAKGEKPGEALSRMRDKNMSWKEISEASGLTQGQARSAVRRFKGTHTSVQNQLGLTGKPTTKLADFLRSRVASKAEFKKEYKRLIKELVELGMPQRARELSGLR